MSTDWLWASEKYMGVSETRPGLTFVYKVVQQKGSRKYKSPQFHSPWCELISRLGQRTGYNKHCETITGSSNTGKQNGQRSSLDNSDFVKAHRKCPPLTREQHLWPAINAWTSRGRKPCSKGKVQEGLSNRSGWAFSAYCGWTKSCTTWKPWETIVCWYLAGIHHSRVSLVGKMGCVHSSCPGAPRPLSCCSCRRSIHQDITQGTQKGDGVTGFTLGLEHKAGLLSRTVALVHFFWNSCWVNFTFIYALLLLAPTPPPPPRKKTKKRQQGHALRGAKRMSLACPATPAAPRYVVVAHRAPWAELP